MGGVSSHFKSAHKSRGAGAGGRRRPGRDFFPVTQEEPFFPHIFSFKLFFLSCFLLVSSPVLAEVVVCAVGWVETLPAMEMTAQATALLVLVLHFSEEKKVPLPALLAGSPGKERMEPPHEIDIYLNETGI